MKKILSILALLVVSFTTFSQSGSFGSTYAASGGEMAIFSQHDFQNGSGTINAGIIATERSTPTGLFSWVPSNGSWINANNNAFVDGYARTYRSDAFVFPIGDNGVYRPAAVSTASVAQPATAAYYGVNPSTAITSNVAGGNHPILPSGGPFNTASKAAVITNVDNVEYWDIDGNTQATITLTWNAATNVNALTGGNLNLLSIVGWDGAKWVPVPSNVDANQLMQTQSNSSFTGAASTLTAGSITSVISIIPSGYTVYTLAGVICKTATTPTIGVNAGTNPICKNGTVQLCPTVWGWANYQWYKNGVAIAAPKGTGACITLDSTDVGSYTLQATDGTGCWSYASNTIVVTYNSGCSNTPFTANTSPVNITTDSGVAKTGTAQLQPQGGVGPYTYRNTTAGGVTRIGSNNGGTVAVDPTTGAYTYTPAAGFVGKDTFYITVCDASTPTPNCATQMYIVHVNGTSGSNPFNANTGTQYISTDSATSKTGNAALQPTGGVSPYTYRNTTSGGVTRTGSNRGGTVTVNPTTGAYVYTPAAGFTGTDTFYITVCDASTPTPNCATQMYIVQVNGSVSGGGGGGVESKTIGDVIAQRLYGNAKASKTEVDGLSNGVKFTNSGVIVNGTNNLKLSDLVPATVNNTDAAYVSTPTDLVNFTNAVEVLAIDYTKANSIKAVAFGTKTLGDVYSHTKPICDRLKGAKLLETKTVTVKGYKLIAYKVQQCTGEVEYAINLSAGTASSRNTISLQSNWFTDSYVQDENLYNFQLWAVSEAMVTDMASDIITKLQANGTVNAVTATDLPKAYVTAGNRKANMLTLNITNNTTATTAIVELKERATETAMEVTRQVPITIQANNVSTVQLDVKDSYEATINLLINNNKTDMLYLNDGTWALDYNKSNSNISKFVVSNEGTVANNANEYRLLRNVSFNGVSKDYVTAYKTIGTKCNALSLSNYNSLKFNAAATGASSVTITLISSDITNWNEQYSYTLSLDGRTEDYAIGLNNFKSSKHAKGVNQNSITGVSFAFNTSRGVPTAMNVSLNNARFSTASVTAAENTISLGIYPNPTSNGKFTASYTSNSNQSLVLKVVELATGRVVKTQFINAVKGVNQTKVELSKDNASGNFIVTLEGDDVKYTPVKVMIGK